MRLAINLVLLAIAAFLVYVLTSSISEPIEFGSFRQLREDAVIDRLKEIRSSQQIYRDVTGHFAADFDTLTDVLKNGRIPLVSVYGDPDDPNFDGVIRYDTSYVVAQDSINTLGINVDSLRFIPYSGGKEFEIDADTVTYQSALVDVVQVGTTYSTFMGKFAKAKYKKYDERYDPTRQVRFGNMSTPSLSGSWDN